MARTLSGMAELGSQAPDFSLPDTDGRWVARADYADACTLLVVFWCNHCPYVKHIQRGFVAFARDYSLQDLGIVAINANDVEAFPADSPPRMREVAKQFDYPFAYLYDETQQVARAYGAQCTPDFFLYDRARTLAYRGCFDGSRPGNDVPVTGIDLRSAVDALLGGKTPSANQQPSLGCGIKWKDA